MCPFCRDDMVQPSAKVCIGTGIAAGTRPAQVPANLHKAAWPCRTLTAAFCRWTILQEQPQVSRSAFTSTFTTHH